MLCYVLQLPSSKKTLKKKCISVISCPLWNGERRMKASCILISKPEKNATVPPRGPDRKGREAPSERDAFNCLGRNMRKGSKRENFTERIHRLDH